MESRLSILSPCSSAQSRPKTQEDAGAAEGRNALERGGVGDPIAAQPLRRRPSLGKGKGVRVSTSKAKTVPKDAASSSCSSSSSSAAACLRRQPQKRGVRLRSRWRSPWASPGFGWEDCLRGQDTSRSTFHDLYFSSERIRNKSPNPIEEFQEDPSLNSMNQLVVHGHITQQLAHVSHGVGNPGLNQSILNTFDRSIMEQTRSNDLKAVELSLIMKKLQMKQSQLALNSYANLLEKIKISMGISKASFKEEKLRNQIQDMKYAELLKSCIDLLVTGLIIMLGFLLYGASIYSYQRIAEATSACTSTFKETRSWWIPKPVASFSSGWLMLRCHFVALTRMSFGLLMILAIAYLLFQRSTMPGPTMPVTFILLLLGVVCGFAGKFCVDTLGGNGYCWLLYWEVLCLLHFFANMFPSAFYHILYGPVSVSQGAKVVRLPYWIRRYIFYSILLLVLPTLSGLLPFASICDWKDHFSEKIMLWSSGNESEL
ncbi:hypothetical protein COCNU_11G000920 [Cocos nucifera]|uniref:Protein CPR-5 n=1 Tax=Cocos nucifera TaxID=13894 RepID=A0A8K0INF3_COCNU|nr:hypothetical protein COCNU_11G000920 [Cocos nucifera]